MLEGAGKEVRQEGLDLGKIIFVSPPLPLLTILRAFFLTISLTYCLILREMGQNAGELVKGVW